MATLKEQAESLLQALCLGLISTADVDAWATAHIGRMETPPFALLELATSKRRAPVEVAPALESLEGDFDPQISDAMTLGLLYCRYRAGKIPLAEACRLLYCYVHIAKTLSPEQRTACCSLDDGCDLAVDGTYGTISDVEKELEEFLAPYEQFAAMLDPV